MKAKFQNTKEFEAALKKVPLSLFSSSGSPKYGAEWKRYKSGDPSEDHFGDLSVVLRKQVVTERVDNRVTRFDHKMELYKRIKSFAKFKVNVGNQNLLFNDVHRTLFELTIEWDYIGGIDPI